MKAKMPKVSVKTTTFLISRIFRRIFSKFFVLFAYFYSLQHKNNHGLNDINIGIICEEFFHEDLRGFGGFGKSTKNISDYFNSNGSIIKNKIIIPQGLPIASKPTVKHFHNADVIIRPKTKNEKIITHAEYMRLINFAKINIFLSIEHYPTYEYVLLASPSTPLIIWIRDPRGKEEWEKISTVPLESKAVNKNDKNTLLRFAEEKKQSITKIIKLSKILKRKIVFVTQAKFLVERAKRTYELNSINPHLLLNPIPLVENRQIKYSNNPSLCLLGRLDPVKRPWIVFELAKILPQVDFYIIGKTHFPELMNPIINKYTHLKNLKFMGILNDKEKNEILKNCWGLINTSIHEALPVSFLETLSFGKPIISCQNPDNLTTRFGFYTGELLSDGNDKNTLDAFAKQIERLLSKDSDRIDNGLAGKKYVEKKHSFINFERSLKNILRTEKIT